MHRLNLMIVFCAVMVAGCVSVPQNTAAYKSDPRVDKPVNIAPGQKVLNDGPRCSPNANIQLGTYGSGISMGMICN